MPSLLSLVQNGPCFECRDPWGHAAGQSNRTICYHRPCDCHLPFGEFAGREKEVCDLGSGVYVSKRMSHRHQEMERLWAVTLCSRQCRREVAADPVHMPRVQVDAGSDDACDLA